MPRVNNIIILRIITMNCKNYSFLSEIFPHSEKSAPIEVKQKEGIPLSEHPTPHDTRHLLRKRAM